MYQIQDLVDDRNRKLYQKLTSQILVVLSDQPSNDGYWGSALENGKKGRVEWSETEWPVASFTHELLHLQFDLDGKAKPGFKVSALPGDLVELQDWVRDFVDYSYNQLIHRKMYPEFVVMGFPPDQFTADSDLIALEQVEGDLEILRGIRKISDLTIKDWGMPFLSLVDVSSNTKQQRKLLNELKQLMGPQQAAAMTKVLRDFDADADPNVPLYMARLLSFDPNSNIEFGYSEDSLVSWPRN